MVNKAVISIDGLTFGGKAMQRAGFSSTRGMKNCQENTLFKGCSPLQLL
jgi:hypothetical protein